MVEEKCMPKYTLGEELVNSISHGIGAGLSIAGLVLLCIRAHSALGVVCGVIYATIMIASYTISCIYHALSPKLKAKKVLRTLDCINSLLMVAGVYTTISLCLLKGTFGWTSFAVVWTVTFLAVAFTAINGNRFPSLPIISNLLLGWSAILIFVPFMKTCPWNGIILLVSGEIVYTIGAILYGVGRKIPYIHSLFHFFVLGASILHYFLIYFYII